MLGAGASGAALDERRQRDIAILRAFGCSNPIGVAELQQGETVLILSAGNGIDVLLSAERVAPTGQVIGLDEADELHTAAREEAAETGLTNVVFLTGDAEAIPLPRASVDVVLGSYATKLVHDRSAVFREVARILRPGGRMTLTEIVAEDSGGPMDPGSVGGPAALSSEEMQSSVEAAGLTAVTLSPLQSVARGLVTAMIRASAPHEESGSG